MAVIRYPLSGGKEFREESMYSCYADAARVCLEEEKFFEATLVCCVGLDVILNSLPDRLICFSCSNLEEPQIRKLENNERPLTGGGIIRRLERARVLDSKLLRALNVLNVCRNRVIHPFQNGKLKDKVILPDSATLDDAENFARWFDHVIDLAGGRSPRSKKRALDRYVDQRNRIRKKPSYS